jgi:1,4-dihydroxy-2-naphthoyl-CoA hydrolase
MEINHDPTAGFNGLVGIEYDEAGPERVVLSLEIDERHHQPYGLVHGGVYCTLVESAASLGAALSAMERGMAGAVGVSNSTDFYRSHRTGRIRATATAVHRGRTQQVWQVDVKRVDDSTLLARGHVRLQNILDPTVIEGPAE